MSNLHQKRRRAAAKSRALVLALHRQALAEAGEKIATAQAEVDDELARVGAQVAGAISAGMRITEIAELTGLSRQKIYELRERYRGNPEDVNMQVLAQLGASGALTSTQIAGQLNLDTHQAEAAVGALEAAGVVKPLMSTYQGGSEETYFKITSDGEERLERWMFGRNQEPDRMSVYVSIGEDEKEALRDVAVDLFGAEWFAIIERDAIHALATPELAFHVVAENPEEAALRARERVDELRRLAKLEPAPTLVSAVYPSGPLHLTFGRRRDWITDELAKE